MSKRPSYLVEAKKLFDEYIESYLKRKTAEFNQIYPDFGGNLTVDQVTYLLSNRNEEDEDE